MTDLKLDQLTHDLVIEDGDLVLVTDAEALIQNLKIRLYTFYGEWAFDTTQGVPYFEDILVKNPNISNIQAVLKSVILETKGVTKLTAFVFEYDPKARSASLNFTVESEFGTIPIDNFQLEI